MIDYYALAPVLQTIGLAEAAGEIFDAEAFDRAAEERAIEGLGELQRLGGAEPEAAQRALVASMELGFGYGQVHAAVTLGLAGAVDVDEAERFVAERCYQPPVRDDAEGLLRFCQGPVPEQHILCFP
jgi:hypothetical protein